MGIYVDQPLFRLGRMRMCHLWGDDIEELHAFVRRLDPRLARHFQCPPAASWHHYDVGLSLRARALRLGAVETDRYGALAHVAALRGDAGTLARVARARSLRAPRTG